MGKVKNYIIQKLGGISRDEFERQLRFARAFDCRATSVIPLVVKRCFDAEEWNALGESRRERIAKAELVNSMASEIYPLIEFRFCHKEFPADYVETSATLRVVSLPDGGEIKYGKR